MSADQPEQAKPKRGRGKSRPFNDKAMRLLDRVALEMCRPETSIDPATGQPAISADGTAVMKRPSAAAVRTAMTWVMWRISGAGSKVKPEDAMARLLAHAKQRVQALKAGDPQSSPRLSGDEDDE